jgi:regulator of protease activity HflC (stomatin/prohibitin superfamily)
MISTLIFITGLIAAILIALKTRGSMFKVETDRWNDTRETFQASWLIKPIGIFVLGLVLSMVQPFAIEKVDSGYKGIKVSLVGSKRGVTNYQYKTGWVVYNTWTEQMLEFPTFQQHIEYDDQQVITKGGFPATIKPTFNYSLKEENIGDMFVNLRLDVKQVEQGWLKNAIIGAVNDVANTWEVDSIFGHRQAFEASIVAECNVRLSKWFNVSQLRTNITPPEALQESIIAKTKAIQQAEASEQQALTAIAEGKRKVAVARADSAELIINAYAAAQAIKIKQNQITPMYIEYLKAQAWDGKLPTTMAGSSGMFLNLNKN